MSAALSIESAGAGPPIVLLHGWALHAGAWGPLVPRLAQRHRVHAVDLPGHGHSAPLSPFTLDAIVGLLDAAFPDAPPLTVLGWSLGGQVALRWARLRPARIARRGRPTAAIGRSRRNSFSVTASRRSVK